MTESQKTATEGELAILHAEVAQTLTKCLTYKSGETEEGADIIVANGNILSIAVKFLKDNEITCNTGADETDEMDALKAGLAARRKSRTVAATPLDDNQLH